MTNIPKPARGVAISDPKFGTQIMRLTNAVSSGNLGIVPHYSKRQAWNADESLLILLNADDGYFGLYNGQTYQYIKPLYNIGGEDVFWHPSDANTLYYSLDSIFYSYNILKDQSTPLHVFKQYSWINTRGEGNMSNNGKYYAFAGQSYNYSTGEVIFKDIVVYDTEINSVVSSKHLSKDSISDFDWVSVSPLGNYIVIDYADEETGRYHGVEVYDRYFNFKWQKPLGPGHSDLGLDVNGDEVLIMDSYDSDKNKTYIRKFRLSDGQTTILLELSPLFDIHESCRNMNRPGWCFVSTFDYVTRLTDDNLSWLPFEDEIFALKMDGSGDVQRIAHHHSRRFSPSTPNSDNSVYWAEPHATVNKNGTKVLWGSNWRQNINQVNGVDTYLDDFSALITGKPLTENNSSFNFTIYPNPVNDEITIETIPEIRTNGLICEIVTISGQTIRIIRLSGQKTKIDLRELKSGFYAFRIKSDNGVTIKKFVKQ